MYIPLSFLVKQNLVTGVGTVPPRWLKEKKSFKRLHTCSIIIELKGFIRSLNYNEHIYCLMPIKLRHKIDFFKGEGLGIITPKKDWHLKFSAKKKMLQKKEFFRTNLCSLPPLPPPKKNHLCTWIKHISQVTVNMLLTNSQIDVKLLPIYTYIVLKL